MTKPKAAVKPKAVVSGLSLNRQPRYLTIKLQLAYDIHHATEDVKTLAKLYKTTPDVIMTIKGLFRVKLEALEVPGSAEHCKLVGSSIAAAVKEVAVSTPSTLEAPGYAEGDKAETGNRGCGLSPPLSGVGLPAIGNGEPPIEVPSIGKKHAPFGRSGAVAKRKAAKMKAAKLGKRRSPRYS